MDHLLRSCATRILLTERTSQPRLYSSAFQPFSHIYLALLVFSPSHLFVLLSFHPFVFAYSFPSRILGFVLSMAHPSIKRSMLVIRVAVKSMEDVVLVSQRYLSYGCLIKQCIFNWEAPCPCTAHLAADLQRQVTSTYRALQSLTHTTTVRVLRTPAYRVIRPSRTLLAQQTIGSTLTRSTWSPATDRHAPSDD